MLANGQPLPPDRRGQGAAHGERRACSTVPSRNGTLLVTTARNEVAMPPRWKALIFLTALLAATLSFASFASARTDNVTVLHLTSRDVESHFVDIAPAGPPPSLGDQAIFSEDLFRDGHKVGVSGGVCTFVRVEHPPAAAQCVVTARIDGNQLTVQGFTFDQPTNVFAITGGTGRWRNAGGQLVVHDISQTESRITLFISDLDQ
ncbi:MAG: allene oxide cyclase barrel-like domain-containing protein [Acidimicrobiales bacterium]